MPPPPQPAPRLAGDPKDEHWEGPAAAVLRQGIWGGEVRNQAPGWDRNCCNVSNTFLLLFMGNCIRNWLVGKERSAKKIVCPISLLAYFLAIAVVVVVAAAIAAAVVGDLIISLCYARGASLWKDSPPKSVQKIPSEGQKLSAALRSIFFFPRKSFKIPPIRATRSLSLSLSLSHALLPKGFL